jgi:hypothetical protein
MNDDATPRPPEPDDPPDTDPWAPDSTWMATGWTGDLPI